MHSKRLVTLAIAMASLLAMPLAAQQGDTVTIAPMTLSFDEGGLSGEGAATLREAMDGAQFVLLGEDHGYADSPRLLGALAAETKRYGFEDYAIEVGPKSVDWALDYLRKGGVDALGAAFQGRPVALPFLNLREEADAAALFTAPGQLWGVDQEFLGAPLVLLPGLADARSGPAREAIDSVLAAERAAFAARDFGAGMMVGDGADRFAALHEALAGDAEALDVLHSLERSARIYGYYSQGRGLDNNFERVALMRENFLRAYAAAKARKGAPPRVLMKFGAVHLSRSTTPMSTFDLGMLVEGMAAENGLRALHIAYLPLGGEGLGIAPSDSGWFATGKVEGDDLRRALLAAEVDLAPVDAGPGHFLIPLAPVVRALGNKGLRDLDPMSRAMVLGYDYLVTTGSAKPATPLATD
jgi:hypothetical protein